MSIDTSNSVRRRGFVAAFVELNIVAVACSSSSDPNCSGVLTHSSPISVELGIRLLIGVMADTSDNSILAIDGMKTVRLLLLLGVSLTERNVVSSMAFGV